MELLRADGIERTGEWFRWRLARAKDDGLSPDCLAAIISVESGFRPEVVNPYSGASGLIGIMPKLAKASTGFSIEQIRTMSAEAQLERIVIPLFKKRGLEGIEDCGEWYMSNFLPYYVGKRDDIVIGDKTGASGAIFGGLSTQKIYEQNYGFDTDKDGVFTTGDVKNFMRAKVNAWRKRSPLIVADEEPPRPKALARSRAKSSFPLLLLGGVVLYGGWRAFSKRAA